MQGLLGGLSNVLETLRGEGCPPSACRAVVHATLRFIDAELLNALMLRRDCCSISAVKALQVGSSFSAPHSSRTGHACITVLMVSCSRFSSFFSLNDVELPPRQRQLAALNIKLSTAGCLFLFSGPAWSSL